MKKTQKHMNKSVSLGLSILELSKILMYGFLYDYVKPKYGEKAFVKKGLYFVSLYTQKQMIFIQTLQKMLQQGLILQIMN